MSGKRVSIAIILAAAGLLPVAATAAPPKAGRNVILFVADGLRPTSIDATETPTLAKIRDGGVWFANSHSVYPTLTMPNAAALATGHPPGDTGIFGNGLFAGFPVFERGTFAGVPPGSLTPFTEDDRALGDLGTRFGGSLLGEESLLATARARGFATAAVGKLGPALAQDVRQGAPRKGEIPVPATIVIDDRTGDPAGIPLPPAIATAMAAAGLTEKAPNRRNGAAEKTPRDNGYPGTAFVPGTTSANVDQQRYFADAVTKVLLPAFVRGGKPFVIVFWSRDPDGTQHFQGDSLGRLSPGINGATSKLGVKNADANLRQLLDALEADPALAARTDLVVTSDHGFSTVSRRDLDGAGTTTKSAAAKRTYVDVDGKPEVPAGQLPPGFLALDLATYLGLPLYDPENQIELAPGPPAQKGYAPVDPALDRPTATRLQHPKSGNALLGGTGSLHSPTDAKVVIAANGGSDLIYVLGGETGGDKGDKAGKAAKPGKGAKDDKARADLIARIAAFLLAQDYVDALFVEDKAGEIPGALPLSTINLRGSARTPVPSIVVAFKTFALSQDDPTGSGVEVADTSLQQGQGMHGSFGRADTRNTMLAYGPDFKRGFVDRAPAGNADVPVTLAKLLGLTLPSRGKLRGRVLTEALIGKPDPVASTCGVAASTPGAGELRTWLHFQELGGLRYLDAAKKAAGGAVWDAWKEELPCTQAPPATPTKGK